MTNKFVSLVCAGMLLAGSVFAQSPCATDEHYHDLLKKYPVLAEYEAQFKAQLSARTANRTTASAPDTVIYDIPLVVHVIHDYGAENVSDNSIFDAVAYWTATYLKQNADTASVITPFIPYIGNPRMHLHLATIDPNGQPTKGIVRTQSYLTANGDDEAKYNAWPNNKYINIWLIGAFGAASSGAAAYAYYPSSGAFMPYYDGVICRYDYLNVQKTVPHELGHVLNLEHTWGSTNNPAVACGDDEVDDTPPTMGHNPGCGTAAVYDVTCATGYSKTYLSSHGIVDSVVNYPDTVNSQNIMDYTYCELMFTKGQVFRMRTALTDATAGRNNLITPANLAATGALAPMPDLPPVADYTLNKAVGGGSVTDNRSYFLTFNNTGSFSFKNASWNDTVTDVLWTFSNGATTPTSTGMSLVNNKFSVPGWVTVSLTANSNAGSNTLVNTHGVYAADTTAAGGPGYYQPFTSAADISNWPMFNYYNNQFKWEYFTGAGYGDNHCLRYRSFDTSGRIFGNATGDHDDIFTPAFNLADATGDLYVDFFTAGASTTNGISGWATQVGDSIEVDASTSGGLRWNRIGTIKDADLANNGSRSTEFTPTSNLQWTPRTVSIPAAYRTNNTFFRLRYWPGNTGNNLYLDNFAISTNPAGIKDVYMAEGSFNIVPNPAVNGCNLVFKTGNDGMVNYSIKDITGKVIYNNKMTYPTNSVQQQAVPRSLTPNAGMYFVTVIVDGVSMTEKLVVY